MKLKLPERTFTVLSYEGPRYKTFFFLLLELIYTINSQHLKIRSYRNLQVGLPLDSRFFDSRVTTRTRWLLAVQLTFPKSSVFSISSTSPPKLISHPTFSPTMPSSPLGQSTATASSGARATSRGVAVRKLEISSR